MLRRGFFITGTDTGVGKTLVSAALLHLFSCHGYRVAGLKPVAAGMIEINGVWMNEDVALLQAASTVTLSHAEVGPYQFQAACAPHIAAELEARSIRLPVLLEAARHIASQVDTIVVEGVGGFRVPLGDDFDSADLAQALELPIILVVGLKLGCLNHAFLTAEAIRARGLTLHGWIGSIVETEMLYLEDNLHALKKGLSAVPCLGVVPWLAEPTPPKVASYLISDLLLS